MSVSIKQKEIKLETCQAFYGFLLTSIINSIIHEHEC